MSWVLLVVVFIIIGYVIYIRKKGAPRLSAQEIKDLVARQMKQIDETLVCLSIEGKSISLPPFLAHLEESKAEHPGDDTYITAIDNLKKDIIKKYGSHIPPDEAFIENGEMIIWSKLPGCFERHLQRRYKSILFPQERRFISKKEIEEARKKDELDKERFIQEIKNFADQLKSQQNLSPQEAISVSRKAQSLIEKAASIGGDLQNEIQALETIEKDIERSVNEVMPEGADLGKLLGSYSSINRIPFMAQLQRKDAPILKNEEVPTLLSEDLSTISFIGYVSRSFPNFQPSEADIKRQLDEALRQGFDRDRAKEIMNAWNINNESL